MAKKKVKSSTKHPLAKHESNMKAVLALFVLFIAFAVFLLFNNQKDLLLNSPDLLFWLLLVVALFGLLTGLLFLVNPHKK